MHRTKGILFVVFLLFGMIITMQFRTILLAQKQSVAGQTSIQSLASELDQVKKEGLRLQEQLLKLEEQYDELISRWNHNDNPLINELLKELREAQLYSGFLDVKGSGVVVTLNDAPARSEMDPSQLIIHDMDIVKILNELRAAGAQALSINGERILATSKQLCTGPTILINKNRYPVPYVIKAIGDPEMLYAAINESVDVIIMRDVYNIQIDVKKEDEIIVPKFKTYYQKTKDMISGLEVVEQ
jgi:uncharacterized protein YlxW (UPF0749 family)